MLKELFTADLLCTTRVVGNSMIPTLKNKQICFYNPLSIRYKRGDIVLIDFPYKRIIKRVIAVEGERIHISRNGKVTINGEQLYEPYVFPQSRPGKIIDTVIPDNCVWVMGDNRGASSDSRDFGAVEKYKIFGRLIK